MQRIVVTGGNKGIGLAICAKLLKDSPNTFVYLGSRDTSRGHAAVDSIERANPMARGRVQALQMDVCDPSSLTAAAAAIRKDCGDNPPPLYGLVNNAGVAEGDMATILGTNLFGVKAAVDAFLPLIDQSQGRIVQISSGSAPMFVAKCQPKIVKDIFTNSNITWSDIENLSRQLLDASPEALKDLCASLGLPDPSGDMFVYGLSKALLNAYTLQLARDHPHLSINGCSPGFIETDLTKIFTEKSGRTAAEMGMKPPEAGAMAPVKLMLGEGLQGNGRYYGSDGLRSPLDRYRSPGDPEYIE